MQDRIDRGCGIVVGSSRSASAPAFSCAVASTIAGSNPAGVVDLVTTGAAVAARVPMPLNFYGDAFSTCVDHVRQTLLNHGRDWHGNSSTEDFRCRRA